MEVRMLSEQALAADLQPFQDDRRSLGSFTARQGKFLARRHVSPNIVARVALGPAEQGVHQHVPGLAVDVRREVQILRLPPQHPGDLARSESKRIGGASAEHKRRLRIVLTQLLQGVTLFTLWLVAESVECITSPFLGRMFPPACKHPPAWWVARLGGTMKQ